MCWRVQPPQEVLYSHGGVTLDSLFDKIFVAFPIENLLLESIITPVTSSFGMVSGTKITSESTFKIPSPSSFISIIVPLNVLFFSTSFLFTLFLTCIFLFVCIFGSIILIGVLKHFVWNVGWSFAFYRCLNFWTYKFWNFFNSHI